MAHPNAEILEQGYAAFASGDLDAITKDWADDIVWHISGSSPLAGDKRGTQEILTFLGELMQLSDGTFTITPKKFLADDDTVVVICDSSATIAGESETDSVVHVFRMRGAKVVEGNFYSENQAKFDELMTRALAASAST